MGSLKLTFTLTCLLALAGCNDKVADSAEQTATPSAQTTLDALYAKTSERLLLASPLLATLLGLTPEEAGHYYADKLDRYDPATEAALRSDLRKLLKAIEAVDTRTASAQVKDNQQVMASIVRYFAGHPDFPIGYIDTWMGLSPYVVNQINSPLLKVPRFMQIGKPLRNERDALDYIARLNQFDAMVDSVLAKLDADVKRDWIAPKVTLQGAVNFLHNFQKSPPADHSLVSNLRTKLADVESISEQRQRELVDQAVVAMTNVVYPAYTKAAQRVAELLPKAREESGIWAQPNGDAYYQDAIRMLGDSDLTAEQIHQLGLDEVNRISTAMDRILRANGYTEGSVGERMNTLNEEPRFLYADSDVGRAELIASLNSYIADITEKMKPYFNTVPPYAVEVRAFAKEDQEGAPGGQYSPPSVDGSKPGIYWINLRNMKENPSYGLKTLTYHEALPGHHLQIALNLAQDELPFLRRIAPYNAYIEGWALYSERVAAEIGMYETDPFSNLGRLQAELFRAVRLVVDTGIHHKRWTREQAIDYMAKTTGTAESDVIAEIERYMAWPGQALGYKLGQLKILALREEAKQALGEKFDLAEFHDLVLLGGAVPMSVLDAKVNAWIVTKQG
ncbi:DUF885 domain-containing protein [Simiduia aestuariiviva]|uniref:Uncharacterized protein (DUF885 family) n=1 Tax=Simiduia aestuariiviva TaxID=1510459 RepID=A0A839UL73_9GAMM|nr:DUF885 domain-containing protein [Simiduia aestuariiviva]MBB3167511.1 uncharacterized protein (DUF885 family) [Simiduia aestuariiviva]